MSVTTRSDRGVSAALGCLVVAACLLPLPACTATGASEMDWIRVADDGRSFVRDSAGTRFVPWGFNYDHDDSGALIEDYWDSHWPAVEGDFREMRQLGANVVRIHLQLGKFMDSPRQANEAALAQLERLLKLAEREKLYLDVTGLACYHKKDVPDWYDGLPEAQRWDVQARFWEAVAQRCARSPAVFCYDLMNEPILPGAKKKETDWLAGEFGGKHFVQRIALDLAGRSRQEVARSWIDKLVAAIRKHDDRHLITLGIIPWAYHFYPGANKPLFYAEDVGGNLDFVSVHFYPKKGEVEKALKALAVYDVGKPIVIEETFPMRCSQAEFEKFIDGSSKIATGWIGFYWGKPPAEYGRPKSIPDAMMLGWLEFFQRKARRAAP